MTSLFRKSQSRIGPPPTPAAEPLPDISPESEDTARRKLARRKGFKSSILTGALTPDTGKKATLG